MIFMIDVDFLERREYLLTILCMLHYFTNSLNTKLAISKR